MVGIWARGIDFRRCDSVGLLSAERWLTGGCILEDCCLYFVIDLRAGGRCCSPDYPDVPFFWRRSHQYVKAF